MGAACTKAPSGTAYTMFVKTGDRIGMGTDATVSVAFYNAQGVRSRDFKLDNLFRNDFESSQTDKFPIVLDDNFGDLAHMEITRDDAGAADAWFCELVRVVNRRTKREHVFPTHRWIRPGMPLKLREYDAVLPQDDDNVKQRQDELKRKRETYVPEKYEKTGMIRCKDLPADENFSISSTISLAQNAVKLIAKAKLMEFTVDNWDSLKELEEIYQEPLFPVPKGVQCWRSDKEFGNQRLAGCNTMQIRLCTKIPDNFAVNEDDLKPLLEGLTTSETIERNRLFIIDYAILKDLPCSEGREVCAPLCLFFVNEKDDLMPVAIQLFPDPCPSNPVFYPTDPEYTWLMAKTYFNLADSAIQQSASHLGFTHLMGEMVVIATHRHLAPSHPIFRLLAPHFLYLLAINSKAIAELMDDEGLLSKNFNMGNVGMAEIVRRTFQNWRLNVEGSLPADLQERGLSDPKVLPNYHYRDDALLLHGAISKFVEEIVQHHYNDSERISADGELQRWAWFLGGEPKCDDEITAGIKGFPNGGRFKTAQEITTVVTDFIFLFSASHAAVNFGQYDNFGYPPAYPSWLTGKPPQDKTALTEKDILDKLPSKKQTLKIMAVFSILSTRDSNPLGEYEIQYMHDPVGVRALDKFRTELQKIGRIIDERNLSREEKYIWLHPAEVPNSIAI